MNTDVSTLRDYTSPTNTVPLEKMTKKKENTVT